MEEYSEYHQIDFFENEELETMKNSLCRKYNLVFDLLLKNPKDHRQNFYYLNDNFNYEFKNQIINFFDKENISSIKWN